MISPSSSPAGPPELQGIDPKKLIADYLGSGVEKVGWEPPTPEHLAALLPNYGVECLIGRGGMGAVYKGFQKVLERPVAIKILPSEMAIDALFTERFHREARTLARLQHRHIVSVYEFGQTSEGHLFFVMEYVEGTDLQRILRESPFDPVRALQLTVQICEALQYAHGEQVIHRDIKPANVLVSKDGDAKLADFGLARPVNEIDSNLTGTGMILGTPDYMAPEQWQGLGDHRTDIFALGVMLYEMLTGKRPKGVFDPPSVKVEVDVRLDQVVLKAMQQEPERRYQQVSEMGSEIDRIRSSALQLPYSPEDAFSREVPVMRGQKIVRRESKRVFWAGMISVLAFSGVGLLVHLSDGGVTAPSLPVVPKAESVLPLQKPEPTVLQVKQQTEDELKSALLSADWTFHNYEEPNHHWNYTLVFHADGSVSAFQGGELSRTWHWWITGPRSINLHAAMHGPTYDLSKGMNLTFDDALTSFNGEHLNLSQWQEGRRKPR